MQSRRVGLVVCLALMVLLPSLAPAASAGRPLNPLFPVAPAPAGSKVFLPLIAGGGSTPPEPVDSFYADSYLLEPNGCTYLHWSTTGAQLVTLDGASVPARGTSSQICPLKTTTYVLAVTRASGVNRYYVTISVASAKPRVEYWADQYAVAPGSCTNLHWSVSDAATVRLNGQVVAGTATQEVCPAEDTTYALDIAFTNGSTATWRITISVRTPPAVSFWAERYAVAAGACTTLHWRATSARSVMLDDVQVGNSGTQEACPGGSSQFYTLEVTDSGGAVTTYEVTLTAGDPRLSPAEVIAQGLIVGMVPAADVDPSEAGNQAGYLLELASIGMLFSGEPGWNESKVTLGVPQSLIDIVGMGGPLDWPVRVGQPVEFRAVCNGNVCALNMNTQTLLYLYLRSE